MCIYLLTYMLILPIALGKPPRVTTISVGGRGVLTITNARPEDEGAYTCEAINNKGSIFAQPDAIVTVKRKCYFRFISQ